MWILEHCILFRLVAKKSHLESKFNLLLNVSIKINYLQLKTEKEFFLEKIYMGKHFKKIILKLLTRLTHFGSFLSNVNYLYDKKIFLPPVVHKSNFNWEFGNTIVIDHGFYLMSL